ncbi:hypothetical protein B0T14DRAFT_271942 [Immersiella caudata]|uniref:Uncharacterized protein n=1 Tax=Immersiella caudata TaxID=314043 RepID=A0AA40BXL6_9PEZI|nr:hypothetical protein B0T14DRAFT_271942 [Immersiella caudata]
MRLAGERKRNVRWKIAYRYSYTSRMPVVRPLPSPANAIRSVMVVCYLTQTCHSCSGTEVWCQGCLEFRSEEQSGPKLIVVAASPLTGGRQPIRTPVSHPLRTSSPVALPPKPNRERQTVSPWPWECSELPIAKDARTIAQESGVVDAPSCIESPVPALGDCPKWTTQTRVEASHERRSFSHLTPLFHTQQVEARKRGLLATNKFPILACRAAVATSVSRWQHQIACTQ